MQGLEKIANGYRLSKIGEIPEGWHSISLGDYIELRSGKSNPTKNLSSYNPIPVYGANGITGYHTDYLMENPTIVIGRVGEYCGSIHITNGKAWITDNAIYFFRLDESINVHYLGYFLLSYKIGRFAEKTGQPKLTQIPIRNINIGLPPLIEQQKIASILSKVDELIQKTDQVIEQTQRLKKGLMQRLFTKGIGHTKLKITRIGEMPEGWQLVLSRDLFSFVTSGSRDWAKYYSQRGTIMIRIENLDHETIYPDFTTVQRVALPDGIEGLRTRVKPNDILVSITADVGMIGVISDAVPEAYVNQHIALVRPKQGINSKYIARYLSWHDGGVKQFRELQGGVTKVGLTLQDVKKIWIPWPSDAEQHKIVSILDSVELVISKKFQYRYKLQDLKKGLMQKLLTGKIRVKV